MELTPLIFAALSSAKKANDRIDELPLPMVFKGTLGTGGTISTLPTASSENEGYVYIVITDGTYAGISAKAGDTFVSDGSSWVLVPSADEPSPIDDSVTSTALTWSSKKISDRMAVKSFTYVGNGGGNKIIDIPSDCNLILSIYGENVDYNNYNCSRTGSIILIDGISNIVHGMLGNTTSDAIGQIGCRYSYNGTNRQLTLTAGTSLYNNNFANANYTVYYI